MVRTWFVRLDNPNQEGAIAELKVATAATCLGVPVLRPMTEHGRHDLAFEWTVRYCGFNASGRAFWARL